MSSTLAAFASRDYRLMWFGLVASNFGLWMQAFAQGWLVVEIAITEGQPQLAPLYLGFVSLARGLTAVVFGLAAGVVADRFDRRVMLTWVHTAQLLASLALALYAIFGEVTVLGLAVLGVLNAAGQSFDSPVRQSMISRMVPTHHILSALGLIQLAWHGSVILGPLVGGLLIIPIGASGIFVVKTLAHVPIILISLALAPQPVERTARRSNPLSDVAESVRYVLADPVLAWNLLLTMGVAAFLRSNQGLLPAITEQVLRAGAPELAILLAATGVGAVIGAGLLAPLGRFRRRGSLLCAATFMAGTALAAFAFQRAMLPATLLLTIVGCGFTVSSGISLSLLQTRSPDALRGRVMSLHNVCMGGLAPLGVMLCGSLATAVGLVEASAIFGAAMVALSVFAFTRTRALRSLESSHT